VASEFLSCVDDAGKQRCRAAFSASKRLFDVFIATVTLLFVLPLLICTALWILADSRGPVIFVQKRTGLNGRPFGIYKFRTMTVTEDGDDVRQATRQDKRVTQVGRFLRRSSIDELPQLLNVLRGEMSLVGPRPHALSHDKYYSELIPGYRDRFRAKPGITGLAQVIGLRGETPLLSSMEARVQQDNEYIQRWSPALDIQILAKTALVLFLNQDAF
jgi:putative colanic acid biosynthesis UDP-glucose lipid carrier transferase